MLQPFRLLSPTTAAEAAAALARLGENARVYAGGAELVLLMRSGLVQAEYLIDVKQIPGLKSISWNGGVRIGAAVTHRELETDPRIRQRLPLLADAEAHVGNIRVRCQGTLGGNLCFADPHADPPTALLVQEATVGLHGPGGPRRLLVEEFLVGTFETAMEPDELVTDFEVPALPAGWGASFERLERFYRPTANVAVGVRLEGAHLAEARIAVGCVGPNAMRLRELEASVRGASVGEALQAIGAARPMLARELDPVDDLLGSADYKLHVTTALLRRALERAAHEASSQQSVVSNQGQPS